MPTNHERFAETFGGMSGKVLETNEILRILLQGFPDMNPGSILPNDHAEGNRSACWCAGTERRVFDRIERGRYRVR